MRALTLAELEQANGGIAASLETFLNDNVLKPAGWGAASAVGIGFLLGQKNLSRIAIIYGCAATVSYNVYALGTALFSKK